MADSFVEDGNLSQSGGDYNVYGDQPDVLNLEDPRECGSEPAGSNFAGDDQTADECESMSGSEEELAEAEPELSPDGVLDEETVARGLSNLGRTADGTAQVYLHLTIPGYSLKDINILADYTQLQRVEVPYNEITDLSALGNMPYLLELDASHNQISSLVDFQPPRNLKTVDLSYNNIQEMTDLYQHHYLQKLVLDNNLISEIKGLDKCHRLSYLSIGHNKLKSIQGLDHLPIKTLNMHGNTLKKIENIQTLEHLQHLDLSGNRIRSMLGLQSHDFLESIDLEGNEVIDLSEVQYVKNLKLLRQLNLLRNPIGELPDYRLSVLFFLQRLTELDRKKVEVEEKVSSCNMFNPPLEMLAARDHIMHVLYNFIQPSRIRDSTLPSIETPYPMLVLVGPQGAGKKDLALKLVEEFPDFFGYAVCHTTRKPQGEEQPDKDYNFVSLEDFEMLVKMGRFMQTYSNHGNLYGLTTEAIEAVAREGLACVVHMELEGVLTLKNTYLEPRYVLIMPVAGEAHERRLRDRDLYTERQIEWTLERADVYADYNREHPGFFDMVINSDDITEAYRRLRRLVMDYLGISVPDTSHSDMQTERTNTESQLMGDRDLTDLSLNQTHRAWSKQSAPDSGQHTLVGVKAKSAQSPRPAGRGVVEEESLNRRKSAAMEAVSGRQSSVYETVLRTPKTVPQTTDNQLNLDDDNLATRSWSAPILDNNNIDALPPNSPDSSDARSNVTSSLSNISYSRIVDDEEQDSQQGSPNELILPDEALDPIEMMSGIDSKTHSGGAMPPQPLAPRPSSDLGSRPNSGLGSPRPASNMSNRSGRPGSERLPVLPPIGLQQQYADPLPQY